MTVYPVDALLSQKERMNQGDIVVVLTPRWHEPDSVVQQQQNGRAPSTIKVHSYTPFTSPPALKHGHRSDSNQHHQSHHQSHHRPHSRSNSQIRCYKERGDTTAVQQHKGQQQQQSKRKSPFSLKMFHITSASADEDPSGSNPSPYGHNGQYSDAEDAPDSHEMIPIKLRDFQKYITMQATCTAV